MPKTSAPRNVGKAPLGDAKVMVDLLQLDAKTKDKDGKETVFTYDFPRFSDDTKLSDVVSALAYKDSKGKEYSGESVVLEYVNTALKNAARSNKLASINQVLALREDPEAAIRKMVDTLVIAYGVPREVAEANVRATIGMASTTETQG